MTCGNFKFKTKKIRRVYGFALAGLRIYVVLLLTLMLMENRLLFPAPSHSVGDPNPEGLGVEDVFFESADGVVLHGWYVEHSTPKAVVLYCHGNGEQVSDLASLARGLHDELGYSVFLFDYRGYGQSQGRPNEEGVLLDAHAAHAWVCKRTGRQPDELVVMGNSLGGAMAVDIAAAHGARALVLERTFTTMPDVAANRFWWAPVRLLMRTQLNSLQKIADYQGPLIQYHGSADKIVPVAFGKRLFAAAPGGPKRFYEMPNLGHNDAAPGDWYLSIARFLDKLDHDVSPSASD